MIAVSPSADFEAVAQFTTGLTGTLGVRIRDNDGNDVLARTTAGIVEDIAGSGIYRVTLTAPVDEGQYTIVWDDADVPTPNYAIDELIVLGGSDIPTVGGISAYATVAELAGLLKVSATAREAALVRVLIAAADEIDSEVGRTERYAIPPRLATEVNLERAVEHWQQLQSPFGIIGLGAEFGPAHTARDSWDRHAHKLAPLKTAWGLA